MLGNGGGYDLRRLKCHELGSVMMANEPKVAVLVILPQSSAKEISTEQTGLLARAVRESPAWKAFPFVEAPFHSVPSTPDVASAFLSTTKHESVVWSKLRERMQSANANEVIATVAPDFAAFEQDVHHLTSAAATRASALGAPDAFILGLAVASSGPLPIRILQDVDADSGNKRDDSDNTAGIRMTPDILTGILVGLLFIFTAWLGLACIAAIQTPSQIALKGPPSLKEW